MLQSPFDVAKAAGVNPILWALPLLDMPAPPITLAAVLALQAPFPQVPIGVQGEPVEIITGTLVQLEGTFAAAAGAAEQGTTRVNAVAVLAGNPPQFLVGVAALPAGAIDVTSLQQLVAQLRIVVAKGPT